MITEELNLSNYTIFSERKSVIDPKNKFLAIDGMICPHCETRMPVIEHGEKKICKKCGLIMENYGNALICTME